MVRAGNGNHLRTNCEFRQFRRAAANDIGLNAEFFNGQIQSVRPVSLVAETFRPGGIPAAKGSEEDLLFWQPEGVDPHLIGSRIRLIGLDSVGAEQLLESAFEPRAFDIGFHHGFRQVGKKSKADARGAQRLNGRLNVRIGLHFQKAVHELVTFFFAQVQFCEPGCEGQRLARDRPEIA